MVKSKVVFISTRNNVKGLYTMNADGTNVTKVLDNFGDIRYASWSPDGNKVTFMSNGPDKNNTSNKIYVIDFTSAVLTPQLIETGSYPSWLPDSNQIAYASLTTAPDWTINTKSIDNSVSPTSSFNISNLTNFSISADGKKVVYATTSGIFTRMADGTGSVLTINTMTNVNNPLWSPDGSKISFVVNNRVYIENADGIGEAKAITAAADKVTSPATWSQDGMSLTYSLGGEIYTANIDGTGTTRLTNDTYVDEMPAIWTSTDNLNISGTADGEKIFGTDGNDIINGLGGNDIINGGLGKDTIDGGAGDDTIIYDAADSKIDGGEGIDTLDASKATSGIKLDMTKSTKNFVNIENLTGGKYNDILIGDEKDNTLVGNAGDDVLDGGAGNDVLQGGTGKDQYIIKSSNGQDTISSNASNIEDTLVLSSVKTMEDFKKLVIQASGDNLVFNLGDGNTVTVENWYKDGGLGSIQLGNGQTFGYRLGTEQNANLQGTAISDIIIGGTGNETIDGGLGRDTINAGDGNDTIVYDANDALIDGGGGVDTLDASTAKAGVKLDMSKKNKNFANMENVIGSQYNDVLTGDGLNNELTGNAGDDILDGGAGDDILRGGTGKDQYIIRSGNGNETITMDASNNEDILVLASVKTMAEFNNLNIIPSGDDLIINFTDSGSVKIEGWYTKATIGSIQLANGEVFGYRQGTANDAEIKGTSITDIIKGGSGNETIDGGLGRDTILAGAGDDRISYDATDALIDGGDGNDTLDAGQLTVGVRLDMTSSTRNFKNIENLTGSKGNDTLIGDENSNILRGGIGDDVLEGGAGNDSLQGGTGKDQYVFKTGSGVDTIVADASNLDDTLVLASVKTLDDFNKLVIQENGNDLIFNLNADDSVTVENWYTTGAIGSVQLGNGQTFGYRKAKEAGGALNGTGINDIILGGSGDDIIDGGLGLDSIFAGAGDDTIAYDANDAIIDGSGGIDTLDASKITTSVNLDLTSATRKYINIENLTGGAGSDTLTGDANDNVLVGGNGDDILTGGAGDDVLTGGAGKDKYVIKNGSGYDTITKDSSNAQDTLVLSDVKTVADFNNLVIEKIGDDLVFNLNTDDSVKVEGWYTGGALGSVQLGNGQTIGYIAGSDADEILKGTVGVDVIRAGAGDDSIAYDAADLIIDGGEGNDTLDASGMMSAVTFDLNNSANKFVNMENLTGGQGTDMLTGNEQANKLVGNAGNDILFGNGGEDVLQGGSGNDILNGGAGDDILDGGNDDDILTSGTGDDVITGGQGKDQYVFKNGDGRDIITADATNKDDVLVFSDIKTMADFNKINIERSGDDLTFNLTDTDSVTVAGWYTEGKGVIGSIQLGNGQKFGYRLGTDGNDKEATTGTVGQDIIMGGAGDDIINGLAGSDVISGGEGSDTIIYDALDSIIDGGAGIDTLDASNMTTAVTLDMTKASNYINIENLTGGKGNDALIGDSKTNILVGNDGNDTLTGNGGEDVLIGGAGDDILNGGTDNDTLTGGTGKDQYMISNGCGRDTITFDKLNTEDTLVFTDIKTLEDFKKMNVVIDGDNLIFNLNANDSVTVNGWYTEGVIGSIKLGNGTTFGYRMGTDGNDILTGTVLSDIIMGGNGDDTIDGGLSSDVISGGAGNDTIIYDALDSMIDGGEGIDILDASKMTTAVTLDMTKTSNFTNIENLIGGKGNDVLTGDGQNNMLTGNDGNDTLTGNGGDDTLDGGAGDDILNGGAGNDTLIGGAGKDQYVISNGCGKDIIMFDSSNKEDTLVFADVKTLEDFKKMNVVIDGDNLIFNLNANDAVTVYGWYKDGAIGTIQLGNGQKFGYRLGTDGDDTTATTGTTGLDIIMGGAGNDKIDGGAGSDVISGGVGDDTVVYDAADSMVDGGDGNDTLDASKMTTAVILDMTKTSVFANIENLIGGSANDVLTGDAQNNILIGGAGDDTLTGGAGDDTLTGGAGSDTYVFGAGFGSDVIKKDQYNNLDTLDFSAFERPQIATLVAGDDLKLTIKTQDNSLVGDITLEGYFANGASRVGKIKAKIDGVVTTLNFQVGNGSTDTLTGTGSSDYIDAGTGNNRVDGGSGNDVITGGSGDNFLNGGDGDDIIWDGAGLNVIHGNAGNDKITAESGSNQLYGDDGNDTLQAWGGDMLLDGGSGDDTLYLNGNGKMIGGLGNDTYIVAGFGDSNSNTIIDNSVLSGDNGVDTLKIFDDRGKNPNFKPKKDDFTYEMNNNDLVMTYKGNQAVIGSTITIKDWAQNSIEKVMFADGTTLTTKQIEAFLPTKYRIGGAGNDALTGDASDNVLIGGAGNDTLTGLGGNDTLTGGTGADTYVFGNSFGSDVITKDVDNKFDTLDFSAFNNPSFDTLATGDDLNLQFETGENLKIEGYFAGNDYKISQMKVKVNGQAMTVAFQAGDNADNTLTGTASSDLLKGGAGNDTINGGLGNDFVDGGIGNDIINGGDGNDTLWDDYGANTIHGGIGNDYISIGRDSADNLVYGDDGDDKLEAYAVGNTVLDGGAGNDSLFLMGNGTMKGGTGNDTYSVGFIYGGNGNGTGHIVIDNSVASGDNGTDTLLLADDRSFSTVENKGLKYKVADFSYSMVNNDLVMTYLGNQDHDDITIKDWKNNKIETFKFLDSTLTAAQIDALISPNLNLIGTGGNDILKGGTGNDTFTGGEGADEYQFDNVYFGNDVITAATSNAEDTITVDNIDSWSKSADGKDLILQVWNDAALTTSSITLKDTLANPIGYMNITDSSLYNGVSHGAVKYKVNMGTVDNDTRDFTTNTDNTFYAGFGGGDTVVGAESAMNMLLGSGGDDTFTGGATFDILAGGSGNDILSGMGGDDELRGGEGNDILDGGDGNDFLKGGKGDDQLTGGSGSDIYRFGDGMQYNQAIGNDVITASASNKDDKLYFRNIDGPLAIEKQGQDLIFKYGAASNLTVQGWYNGSDYQINKYKTRNNLIGGVDQTMTLVVGSENGDTYNAVDSTDANALAPNHGTFYAGMAGDDIITGGKGNDWLYGGDGDDVISGGTGNDILNSGAGSDKLTGGSGNDTYVVGGLWNANDHVTIDNSVATGDNGTDTLKISGTSSFIPKQGDFSYSMNGADLVMKYAGDKGSGDITIKNWNANKIENFQFIDGTLTAAQIEAFIPKVDTPINATTYTYDISTDKNIIIDAKTTNSTMNLQLIGSLQGDWDWLTNASPTTEIIYSDPQTKTGPKDLLLKFDNGHSIMLKEWFNSDTRYRLGGLTLTLPMLNISMSYKLQFGQGTSADEIILVNDNQLTTTGGAGNDVIFGKKIASGEAETISGGDGDDIIITTNDGDGMIYGNAGNDTIIASSNGQQTLTGGTGKDTYVFELGNGINSGNDYFKAINIVSDAANSEDTVRISIDRISQWIPQFDANHNYIGGHEEVTTPVERIVGTIDGNDLVLTVKKEDGVTYKNDTFAIIKDWNLGSGYQPTFNIGNQMYEFKNGGFVPLSAIPLGTTTTVPTAAKDTYEYTLGSGSKIIKKDLGNNQDTLKINIDPQKLITMQGLEPMSTKSADGKDLILALNSQNQLIMQGWFEDPRYRVSNLVLNVPGSAGTFMGSTLNLNFSMVTGTPNSDNITGTSLNEIIFGDDGNDTIHGGAGMDLIDGGAGNDSLYGDDGDDIISGNNGNDTLYGGAGNDMLMGGQGQDLLVGGTGSDSYMIGADLGNNSYWQSHTNNMHYSSEMDTIAADNDNVNDKVMFDKNLDRSQLMLQMNGSDLLIFKQSAGSFYNGNTNQMENQSWYDDVLTIKNFSATSAPTFKFMNDNSTHTIDIAGGLKWK